MTKEEALSTLMKMRAWRAWGKEQIEEERPEMPEPKDVDEAFNVCIELLQKPSLPSNLDDAAEKNFETMEVLEHENIFEETHNRIFKAGVEWMAGQGETQIVRANADLDPYGTDYGIRSLYIKIEDNIPVGTKFIVQIRKE